MVQHMSWLGLRLLVSIQLYLISLISPASITFQYSRIYLESLSQRLNINKSEDQLSLSLSLLLKGKKVWGETSSPLQTPLHCQLLNCCSVESLPCCPANISIYKIDFLSLSQFVLAAMFTVQIISLNIAERLFGRIMQMTIINYSPPRQDAQLKFALININKQSTTGWDHGWVWDRLSTKM